MKRFALIGAGGYIAPRHLRAIKETGNTLVAAMDVNDSVGIMDSHFPDAEFFTEFEQFASFVEEQKLRGSKLDYVTVCSPNYLHAPHVKFALKNGIDVICEKPLVLNVSDLAVLSEYEQQYGARVNTVLQLRLHPAVIALRDKVASAPADKVFDVDLTYLTARGKWYLKSWKGYEQKSGGVATNIGVHFYDMLQFVFGDAVKCEVHYRDEKTVSGYSEYQRGRVRWFLSIDAANLPEETVKNGKAAYRSIKVENQEWELSDGFTDLHTHSYRHILEGKGFGLAESRAAIEAVEYIRKAVVKAIPEHLHPFLVKLSAK